MSTSAAKTVFGIMLLSVGSIVVAEDAEVAKAIEQQVDSANDCQELAYGVELKNFDADRLFSECVERRAIRIAILKKYGPEKLGKIDVIDKLEAYSYLAESRNDLVQKEASLYMTAAGPQN
ncbi:MAG: hypothetical protein K6L74_01105 [Neptuniibacter sp.]